MKRYWKNIKTNTTKTTWGKNLPVNIEDLVEITAEEKERIDAENLKEWAKRYNGEG